MTWSQFKNRVSTCYKILFGRRKHWVFVSIKFDELVKMIQEEVDCNAEISYHGLDEYHMNKLIDHISNNRDEVDKILDKAIYQAKREELK